jgi:preprotein translocase subunit SecE
MKIMAKTGPIEFLKQVRSEAKKVTWPTRQETTVSTIAVFIMVFVASLFLYFADQLMAFVVHLVMSIGL